MSKKNFLPQADYKITVDGVDITRKLGSRLISLSITDNRGLEADTLSLSLSDFDGKLAIPPNKAELHVWIGWKGKPLVDKGIYIVDETGYSIAPDIIDISAASADMGDSLPGRKSRSWHKTTVLEMVSAIAAEHGLEPAVESYLGGLRINHIDQTEESDLNILTRVAKRHDAIATVKSGRLIFVPAAKSTTASGKELPPIKIRKTGCVQANYRNADRDAYTGVKAFWNNVSGGKRQVVLVGDGEKVKELRNSYASEEEALQAAQAELNKSKRGQKSLDLVLEKGEAELIPETPLLLIGFKPEIDATNWLAIKVHHVIDGSGGFTTQADFEEKLVAD